MRQPPESVRMESIGPVPEPWGDLVFAIDVIGHDQAADREAFCSLERVRKVSHGSADAAARGMK